MRIIKKLLNVLSAAKKNKPIKTLEKLEALKKEFLEIDSYLSSTVLSSIEKKEANAKLYSLATEISLIFGGPESVYVLANVLRDVSKDKVEEPSEALKEMLRSVDLPTLIKEFRANLVVMLCALRGDTQKSLNVRLGHVATEIANRLGGPEFLWTLSAVLEKNKAV